MVRIVFLHPDLGIGGAERLVVDAAVALQRKGHHVDILTSHCDASHCFPETQDGTLRVEVAGDWLPRHLFGSFHLLCAILRMLWLSVLLLVRGWLGGAPYSVVFCDQVSYTVPVLRWSGAPVLFYCHHPDKLLTQRKSLLKALYRVPFDYLEEKTTAAADAIVANSEYTVSIMRRHFPSIRRPIGVIYPTTFVTCPEEGEVAFPAQFEGKRFFLSLNRYEEKKNVALAVQAFQHACAALGAEDASDLHLVIAGGYDERVEENERVAQQLRGVIERCGLQERCSLLFSISSELKEQLIYHAMALIYTPADEHFGIVPVESMVMGTPVVAANSGGPKESVVDGETGYLCEPTAQHFGDAMLKIVQQSAVERRRMGEAGKQRVRDVFGPDAFAAALDAAVKKLATKKGAAEQKTKAK